MPPAADDLVLITFLYPGGVDRPSGRQSDGKYDFRGPKSIQALGDVILYAAGKLRDDAGRTIDEVLPVGILHDNIGLLGKSNGGNIIVAVAALHGDALKGHLRYIIQWETPVSSQIATRDLGRIILHHGSGKQGNYLNPRYSPFDPMTLTVDYGDLAFDPEERFYRIIHDGNGDGRYTTVHHPGFDLPTPDLDLDGTLSLDEDFPLDSYPGGSKRVYSRPVSRALAERQVFGDGWPADIATPAEADAYWDLREAVRLYGRAVERIPDLQAMVLCSVRDHVQSAPDKPHIRQAFEGWRSNGAWVKINPSPDYLIEVDSTLSSNSALPDNAPNTAPNDWAKPAAYAMPETVPDEAYQLAAVWQMADGAHGSER
jgi:hypothetical protein